MKKNVLWVKNKSILFAKILNIIYNNRTLIGGINMDTINLITNLYNEYKMFGISEECFYETVREIIRLRTKTYNTSLIYNLKYTWYNINCNYRIDTIYNKIKKSYEEQW